MLFRPQDSADNLKIEVHREVPSNWPSAAVPGDAVCHIFQTREFLASWNESFGVHGRYTPLYVEVQDANGRPIMLLPLVIETRRGARVLTFIDQGHADYNGPVLFPPADTALTSRMPGLWLRILSMLPPVDVIRLEKMPAQILGHPNPLCTIATGPNEQSCHGNDLTKPLAAVEGILLSPKELRSKQRGLEKIAPVSFVIAEDRAMRDRMLETLIVQKQRRFEETRVPGFVEKPDALVFLRRATEDFGRTGSLFVCALLVGEDIVAVQWGLKFGRHLYALMTSFAGGEWAKFSCGRILNYRLLQWLHANGFTYFDQGFGDEPYKLQNSDTTVPLHRALIGHTARGRRYLQVAALAGRIQSSKLWERLRQLKWVVLRGLRRSPVVEPR